MGFKERERKHCLWRERERKWIEIYFFGDDKTQRHKHIKTQRHNKDTNGRRKRKERRILSTPVQYVKR